MALYKKVLKLIAAFCMCYFTVNAFAADSIAKEELSPPADEGPLTAEQIPPIEGTASSQPASSTPQNPAPAQAGQMNQS
jgi:hypothetical protein